ncbi:IS3 family transposase [Pseudocitrobacter faecalis]
MFFQRIVLYLAQAIEGYIHYYNNERLSLK